MKPFKEWMADLDRKALKNLRIFAVPGTDYTIPTVLFTQDSDSGEWAIGGIHGVTPAQFRQVADDLERYQTEYNLIHPESNALA